MPSGETSSKSRGSQGDDVFVKDFGNPEELPSHRIRAPRNKEDWDNFITRYALAEFASCSFDAEGHPVGPKSVNLTPTETAPASPPPLAEFPSSETVHPVSSTVTAGTSTPPALASRFNSSVSVQTTDSGDSPETVSQAGPSNQDPEIPNIPQDVLPESSLAAQRAHQAEIDAQVAEARTDSGKPQHSMAMTIENMGKLKKQQKEVSDKRREGQTERGSRRSREAGPRRPAEYAELAEPRRKDSGDSSEDERRGSVTAASTRRRPPRNPRSRGSWSRRSKSPPATVGQGSTSPLEAGLLDSGTNDSTSASAVEIAYDHGADRQRVRTFFDEQGYLPPPQQTPDVTRRRLRVIRRLGLETIDPLHRRTLDRFTRLAVSVFKTNVAAISIIGKDKQTFLSEVGIGLPSVGLDVSICCHTVVSGHTCMVVEDLRKDWRFNANPFVGNGSGPMKFYAGAPLKIGSGGKSVTIGTLCITDDKPRSFTEHDKELLSDLADCVVSELELIYSQQASVESAKLHQISVDFLRRSLKHRPNERAGQSRPTNTGTTETSSTTSETGTGSGKGKRISGADEKQDQTNVDIYDEACREIRTALDAHAVAVVDLSQFHLFYPTYQNSSTGGGSSTRGGSSTARTRSQLTGQSGGTSSTAQSLHEGEDETEAYAKPNNAKRARQTYAMTDPLAPSRTPQVLFIPSRRKSDGATWGFAQDVPKSSADNLAVLGYSSGHDDFAFNFTNSPAARKIIADFIASNVKTRRVWYTRDDNEGIAQSITHLMPPGTETSMAMPIFGFDGQVAFAVVACWTDPLYTYPAGALQFVETIAGSLLASVMKERLHQAERAQLNFAAAASHELRTPLHQINAAASLLRSVLHHSWDDRETSSKVAHHTPAVEMTEDRLEVLSQLEIIEANGMSLGNILENIIDTLDIGKAATKVEATPVAADGTSVPQDLLRPRGAGPIADLADILESVVDDAMKMESKARRIHSGKGLENVEVIVEVLPRYRGVWKMTNDSGPLARALGKIIHNAVKFTEKGHIHITMQDVSRDVVLPAGYDNSIKLSTVSFDIKDTGKGMSSEFLDKEVLRPFAKEDPFTSGSGLGLGLAQRMVELLGGKLAIASTPGKGTLVHVEVPLHLLNTDNDSDQDVLATTESGSDNGEARMESVRQDGIYLAGWAESKDPATRRVGKSLARQLKLHFCRVVSEINYASLIVVPEGGIKDAKLVDLCRSARPTVQVIVLGKDLSVGGTAHLHSPTRDDGRNPFDSIDPNDTDPVRQYLRTGPIIRLTRPLRPSVIKRIMQPPEQSPRVREFYKSDVVGGPDALPVGIPLEPSQTSSTGHLHPSIQDIIAGLPGDISDHQDLTESDADEVAELRPKLRTLVPSPHQAESPPASAAPGALRLPKLPVMTEDEITSGDSTSATPASTADSLTSEMTSLVSRSDPESEQQAPALGKRSASDQTVKNKANPPTGQKRGLKVLVVEDNAVNRKILTTMLKRTSCEFAEAADGVEAVAQFDSFQPDLVLLDINMPRKDGFAAAAEMRHLEAALTAESDVPLETVMKSLALGDEGVARLLENQTSTSRNPWGSRPGSPNISGTSSQSGAGSRRAKIIAVTAMSAEHQRRKGLIESGIDMWMVKPIAMRELRGIIERMKEEKELANWSTNESDLSTAGSRA
ncbi:hypothetical protein IAU60_003726 [Kwoniella sp. DSM 27419]